MTKTRGGSPRDSAEEDFEVSDPSGDSYPQSSALLKNRTVGSVCSAMACSVPVVCVCDSIHVEKTEASLSEPVFFFVSSPTRTQPGSLLVASACYAKLTVSTRV